MGEHSFCHHSNTKNMYIDELVKYSHQKRIFVALKTTNKIFLYCIIDLLMIKMANQLGIIENLIKTM